jgi:hypothetical protein
LMDSLYPAKTLIFNALRHPLTRPRVQYASLA